MTAVDEPGRYTAALADGTDVAGVMDASGLDAVSPGWSVHWEVADVEAALCRAQELGGSVEQSAMPTPYGTLATCRDSTGALLKLRTPPR